MTNGADHSDLAFRAAALHREALVWDNHGCLPLRADDRFLDQLNRYTAAGVNMVHINVGFGDQSLDQHIRVLGFFRRWIAEREDRFRLVQTANDILVAKKENKLAIAFDMEGGTVIADQPGLIELFYQLGVRWMLLAYNKTNALAGGCDDEDSGLTPRGRQVLDEMMRVGMVVCCSHMGHRTALQIFDYVDQPVIFSHSNPHALADHVRNIPDDLMRACAQSGGVLGISGIGAFLGDVEARTETFVRHIDYAVQVMGADHVGLGLDFVFDFSEMEEFLKTNPDAFPGYSGGAAPIVSPEQLPDVTENLLRLGYAEEDIRAVLGENFLRVAGQVWK